MLVSVVIPSYKAENFIVKTLKKVKDTLDKTRYDYEIICVVDGQVDNTYNRAKRFAAKFPGQIKVVGYKKNLGKGHAVRYGMSRARGDIVGFIDAGLDIDPNSISMLLEHFEWYKADAIIGSKRHPASRVNYPWYRKVISIGYQLIVRVLFGLNIRDTQVGLKFYKKKLVEATLPRLLVKAFAFDIELLAVAHSLGFVRIYEAPVVLKMRFNTPSTIVTKKFANIVYWMFVDTLAVFYRLKLIRYYDYKNRSNWHKHTYLSLRKKHSQAGFR